MSSKTDEELMVEIQNGSMVSFEILYNRHKVSIYNYFYKILRHRESAEDCAQTAFITLYNKASYYKPVSKFMSWFFTLAKNIAFDHLRKKKVRSALSLDAELGTDAEGAGVKLEEMIASADPTPDQISQHREELQLLEKALARLSDDDRNILTLCDIEKMPYEEVAKIINCSVETVRVKVHRARARLIKLCGGPHGS